MKIFYLEPSLHNLSDFKYFKSAICVRIGQGAAKVSIGRGGAKVLELIGCRKSVGIGQGGTKVLESVGAPQKC